MSFPERKNTVYLITNIVVSIAYFMVIAQQYIEVGPAPYSDFRFWGSALFVFIPVQIVTRIIIHIIFSIINTIITQEEEPDIIDEFDKRIESKATLIFYDLFIVGFFLSVATIFLDTPPFVMLVMFLFTATIAGIAGDIARIIFYRRGLR
jgi:hypothetical protein